MRTIFSSDLLPFGMSVFVNASWKSLLLLLLATVAAFAARRSSAAVRHRIWCLSLSALIFLPALSVFVPRWNVALLPAGETPQALNDRGSASTATTPSPGDISKSDRSSQPAPELPDQSGPAGPGWFSLTSPFANLGGPGETQSPMDGLIRMALIALWIVIAFALLGRLAVEIATVRRLAGRCRPLCDERWN